MKHEISITGMSCGHCVSAVEKLVKEIPQVSNINVSLSSSNLTVTSTTVSKAEIIEKINSSEIYKAS